MKSIRYKGLHEFLNNLKRDDFGVKLKEANSIDDIEYFNMDTSKLLYEQVINYGDYFLVDAIGNDLSVCKLTRRKYKLPTGRVVKMKLEQIVINDCHTIYGTAINGYWVIPKEFINQPKQQGE